MWPSGLIWPLRSRALPLLIGLSPWSLLRLPSSWHSRPGVLVLVFTWPSPESRCSLSCRPFKEAYGWRQFRRVAPQDSKWNARAKNRCGSGTNANSGCGTRLITSPAAEALVSPGVESIPGQRRRRWPGIDSNPDRRCISLSLIECNPSLLFSIHGFDQGTIVDPHRVHCAAARRTNVRTSGGTRGPDGLKPLKPAKTPKLQRIARWRLAITKWADGRPEITSHKRDYRTGDVAVELKLWSDWWARWSERAKVLRQTTRRATHDCWSCRLRVGQSSQMLASKWSVAGSEPRTAASEIQVLDTHW